MIKSNFKIKNIKQLLVLLLLFLWLILSGSLFLVQMRATEIDEFEEMMQTAARNNANAVEMSFSKYISLLTLVGDSYRASTSLGSYFRDTAVELVRMEDFSYINLVLPEDKSYLILPDGVMPIEQEFSEKMLSEEVFISEVYKDDIINKPAIAINVPIRCSDDLLIGYLVGVISTETLSKNFEDVFYDLEGYFHIIDSDGFYVAVSESENMLLMDISFKDAIYQVEPFDGYNAEDVENAFADRTEGMVRYHFEGDERASYYAPVHINNWIIFLVVPGELIEEGVESDFATIFILILNISCIFMILLVWVYRSQRDLKKFAESKEKNFRFMSEQTNKCIVEWNFKEQAVKITGRLNELFNIDEGVTTVSSEEFFHALFLDDIQKMKAIARDLEHGKHATEIKIRLSADYKTFTWCSFSAVPISLDEKGMCEIAIGFLENIHEQEEEAALLRRMSELDSLTQVYNKGTTEDLIEKIIKNAKPETDQHTLLIIDLDNFKQLNDTFGHQFGDKVIMEMAEQLRTAFRSSDIIGRIGGDEFFVFMQNISSDEFIVDKCNEILNSFNRAYLNDEKQVEISVSIGVATYPAHAETFSNLYQCADIALYNAKSAGRNTYKFFDVTSDSTSVQERTSIER